MDRFIPDDSRAAAEGRRRDDGNGTAGRGSDGSSPLEQASISTLDRIQNLKIESMDTSSSSEEDIPAFARSPLIDRKPVASRMRHLDGERPKLLHQHSLPSMAPSRRKVVSSASGRSFDTETRKRQRRLSPVPTHLTPLYQAVSAGASLEVIQPIAREDPSSVTRQNGGGLTPLHCAIERYDTPVSVLLMLLEADPSTAALRCARGFTPIDLLWKRYVDPDVYRSDEVKTHAACLRAAMEGAVEHSDDASSELDELSSPTARRQALAMRRLQDNRELRDFWDIITTFIRASSHGTTVATSPSPAVSRQRLVQDAVLLGCQPLLIRFAAALHPQELLERAQDSGRVALHMAAAHGSVVILQTVLELEPRTISVRDSRGQLPLHVAIQAHLPWEGALERLVAAWPHSLTIRDPGTRLLPTMLAAVHDISTNAIFNLLASNPIEVCRPTLDR